MVDTTIAMNDLEDDGESMKPGGSAKAGLLGVLTAWFSRMGLTGRRSGEWSGDGTADSMRELLQNHEEGSRPLSDSERGMLLNVLKFPSLRVDDVMVPRADIIALEKETCFWEAMALFKEAGHSRLPLYSETLDHPIGMIHIKDLLAALVPEPAEDGAFPDEVRAPSLPLSRLRKDVLFVPPSMPAADLLVQMQSGRVHMALVIDEYGGTDGLVTIEDLVEKIVGDIEDEHDVDSEPECTAMENGGYLVSARMEIEEFQTETTLDLRLGADEDEEVDTLGGLAFTLAGRVPKRGEILRHPRGFDLEIVEADARRIRRMRVIPRAKRGAEVAPSGALSPQAPSKGAGAGTRTGTDSDQANPSDKIGEGGREPASTS